MRATTEFFRDRDNDTEGHVMEGTDSPKDVHNRVLRKSMEEPNAEREALKRIVSDWINDGFTTPPYPPGYYDVFEKLGLSSEDFSYDIDRPGVLDKVIPPGEGVMGVTGAEAAAKGWKAAWEQARAERDQAEKERDEVLRELAAERALRVKWIGKAGQIHTASEKEGK